MLLFNYKSKKVLVSTDFLVEGVHFDLSYMPLKHLGYKAVMVNLDICNEWYCKTYYGFNRYFK